MNETESFPSPESPSFADIINQTKALFFSKEKHKFIDALGEEREDYFYTGDAGYEILDTLIKRGIHIGQIMAILAQSSDMPVDYYEDHSGIVEGGINEFLREFCNVILEYEMEKYPDVVKEKMNVEDPVEIFRQALDNIKPIMEVRSRRVGGAAYQVPVPVKGDRKEALAIRWLITASRARENKEYKSFGAKLAAELMSALNNEGAAVKKRNDTHRSAEANKAFAHFRW